MTKVKMECGFRDGEEDEKIICRMDGKKEKWRR